MSEKYMMSLDQGTTGSRCIIFDKGGNVISSAIKEYMQIYPKAGYVEHNPSDILASQLGVISEALALGSIKSGDIKGIGIANQRETTIVWNKHSGRPVYNAIVWQCRRTSDYCNKLNKEGFADMIYNKTGLVVDAYFSATKLKWILDNIDGARKSAEQGELLFGTVDTFILWHLSGRREHATDYTNASRTMLFNIHTLEWDEDLLKLFNIPKEMLPTVKASGSHFGYTDESTFGAKVPIAAMMGDQQSALFGQFCLKEGDIKNTYGTGCFMLMNTGKKAVCSKNGLVTTLVASLDEKPCYALEGSVFIGGAVVQWLRDNLRMFRSSSESEKYAALVKDTNGVYFVPAFVGLGSPYWDSEAKGIITGITRGVSKEHFIRAALESIAYQTNDVLQAMEEDYQTKIKELSVDGGASENDFLMQFQSDISNITINRPKISEVTAFGASYLAGLVTSYWKDIDELKANLISFQKFHPKIKQNARKTLLDGWSEAIRKARL
ncbi:sugar kinase [Holotrichia oblita]|nr:sugar kinase [Holotrichia oblita]